jgi:hypothetical protein
MQLQFGAPHWSAQLFGYSSSTQALDDNADAALSDCDSSSLGVESDALAQPASKMAFNARTTR